MNYKEYLNERNKGMNRIFETSILYDLFNNENVVEEGIFKKKNNKKEDKRYVAKEIKDDIKKILTEVKKIMEEDEKIKPYFNKVLFINIEKDIFGNYDKKQEDFKSDDEFTIVRVNSDNYKNKDDKDSKKLIHEAESKFRGALERILKEKFPHFYLCNVEDGDWDNTGIEIALR
jgi:hypothetical protein